MVYSAWYGVGIFCLLFYCGKNCNAFFIIYNSVCKNSFYVCYEIDIIPAFKANQLPFQDCCEASSPVDLCCGWENAV